MIKTILWDLDNTVLDFTAAERASLKRAWALFGFGECSDEMAEDYARINVAQWEMLERGEKSLENVLVDRFAVFLEKYGRDPKLGSEFTQEYEAHIGDTLVFIPNAKETLEALKGKVIQCCATNGVKAVQERRLRESGLDRIFDKIFISTAMGAAKPSREYYDMILRELDGLSRDEVLMVGDSLTSDMLGAANAGIPKCFFNRKHTAVKTDLSIECIIDDISEVPGVLARFV